MSWSRGITGSPSSVRKQLEHAVAEVERYDRSCTGTPPERVIDGHRVQVTAAKDAVLALTDKLPDTVSISGSIFGHASEDGTGTVGIRVDIGGSFA